MKMTIEKQREYIKEYQNIIQGLSKKAKKSEWARMYILGLEKSISEREQWIKERR